MSIYTLKESLKEIDGINELAMRYESGGKIQVYSAGGIEVRVPANATVSDIRKAFIEAAAP